MQYTAHWQLKFFSNYKGSPIYRKLVEYNINIDEDTTVAFNDSSCDDFVYMGRSTDETIQLYKAVLLTIVVTCQFLLQCLVIKQNIFLLL